MTAPDAHHHRPVAPKLEVRDRAFGPVRGFCAEYLSALAFAQAGDHAVLHGGATHMYDIATHPYYTDTKVLAPMESHEKREAQDRGYESGWKLFLPGSGQYATVNKRGAKRTHLGLVRLVARYSAVWTGTKLVIEATPEQIVCSWIPTDDVNTQIADWHGTVWYVPNDWLRSYPAYEIALPGQCGED